MSDTLTAEEFYRLRDDRTNRCTDRRGYQRAPCTVYLSPSVSNTLAGQVMLLASANLLSRWCRHVTLVVPATVVDPALGLGDGLLGEVVLEQMCDADPFGEFSATAKVKRQEGVMLCIGEDGVVPSGSRQVFINSVGWLAGVSSDHAVSLPGGDKENPLGAVAAACLGGALVFKLATGLPKVHRLQKEVFDLFRLDWVEMSECGSWPPHADVGQLLMVGAGSVGSSVAYCIRLSGIRGSVTIVGHAVVKIENLSRSPIFSLGSIRNAKAAVVADFLEGGGLSVAAEGIRWNTYVEQHERSSYPFDIWLPLANEDGVRYAMQHGVPPLMIHASTTANWGVNHGRHLPIEDDCLVDRFPAEAVTAEDLACSTGRVSDNGVNVDAALPFLSLFAGLLVTADLVRTQLEDYPQVPNFALFDWYGAVDCLQKWDRKPSRDCICRQQHQGFHRRLNRGTKYWPFFRLSGLGQH